MQHIYMIYFCFLSREPVVPPMLCARPCHRVYRPVCDSTGKSYANECVFANAKCKNPKLKSGPCKVKPPVKRCNDAIPAINAPVICGGKKYRNIHLFNHAKCSNPKKYANVKCKIVPVPRPPRLPSKKCDNHFHTGLSKKN